MSRRTFLLALVMVFCLRAPLHSGDGEAAAVKALEKIGAKITRDEQQAGKPVIGIDLARKTDAVTDQTLMELAVFKQLRSLDLTGCYKIKDAGVKALAACPQLQTLSLAGC